jgi:hypothetical protein
MQLHASREVIDIATRFELDPISPGYEDDSEWADEDDDYYIMSRRVNREV